MNNKKKSILVLVSLVLLLCLGAGGTLAYLLDQSGPVTNEFQPTQVTTTVVEDIDGSVKNNVKIQNTGSTEAYIRAAVVITWQDAQGNVYGKLPVKGTDYEITFPTNTNWAKSGDFYYYKKPVPVDDPATEAKENLTEVLFTNCQPVAGKAPEGYNLCVEIIGSGIQSQPKSVVLDNWKVDPTALS